MAPAPLGRRAVPALVRRHAERTADIATVRRWAGELDPSLGVRAVVIFGSVARGDFNVWSDVDVLVVADHLPDRWPERLALLWAGRPARLCPLGWTPEEYRGQLARRNPIAVEASERGIVVGGRLDRLT